MQYPKDDNTQGKHIQSKDDNIDKNKVNLMTLLN